MKQKKLAARERVDMILAAALTLAVSKGYTRVTACDIGKAAGMPSSLVAYHMGTMSNLRRDIMREAVRTANLPILAQGLAVRDPHALKAPDELRRAAAAHLST